MIKLKSGKMGVLILVCLSALIAVPVLAAAPGHGFPGGSAPVLNSTMETKMYNSASTIVTSLQNKGVDVSNLGLVTALANVQSAIGPNSTAFKDAIQTFRQDIMADIKDGSIPKTDLSAPGQKSFPGGSAPVLNSTMETKMYNSVDNTVTSLQNKGVDVSNLGLVTALANVQSAIGSNSTAFKDAMQTFRQDIMADIKDGSIPKTDLPIPGQGHTIGTHASAFTRNHAGHFSSTGKT